MRKPRHLHAANLVQRKHLRGRLRRRTRMRERCLERRRYDDGQLHRGEHVQSGALLGRLVQCQLYRQRKLHGRRLLRRGDLHGYAADVAGMPVIRMAKGAT